MILENMHVDSVHLYAKAGRRYNLTKNIEHFEIAYLKALSVLKECIHGILSGKRASFNKIDQIVDYIFEIGINNNFILKHEIVKNLDEYLYTHSINVGILSMLIANWLKFDYSKTVALIKAAVLHDIGKCKVDQKIINKQGPLLQHEYDLVKEHVYHGLNILRDFIPDGDICMGVFTHHERCDGSGYPNGLERIDIHEFGRIIAVADVYDAMTSNRVYRPKKSPFDVFEHIQRVSMFGLDIEIALTFLNNVSNYYLGDDFMLNNGELCKIINNNPFNLSRPLIKIGERFVDLSKNNELRIVEIA